jgi:acyl-CoA thioesterase
LAAAYESVPPSLTVHHVHIEFLQPAMVGRPLRLDFRCPMPAAPHYAPLFLSDFTILWPTMTVHGLNPARDRHSVLGSVAHTMWFHRDGRADDWLLYDQRTPTTSGGLGHAEGRIGANGSSPPS